MKLWARVISNSFFYWQKSLKTTNKFYRLNQFYLACSFSYISGTGTALKFIFLVLCWSFWLKFYDNFLVSSVFLIFWNFFAFCVKRLCSYAVVLSLSVYAVCTLIGRFIFIFHCINNAMYHTWIFLLNLNGKSAWANCVMFYLVLGVNEEKIDAFLFE